MKMKSMALHQRSVEIEPALRVIITGAAAGIGKGIRDRFLAAGHSVCSADPAHQQGFTEVSRGDFEAGVDVSDSGGLRSFVETAAKRMSGIDVLVNNAGIGGAKKSVADLTDGEWAESFRVNVDGPFYAVRASLPYLRSSGNASIVNIATASVKLGLPNRAPYIASKLALVGLNRTLVRELGPAGIRCNIIHPGVIENERGDALMKARAERMGVTFEEAMRYRMGFVSMRKRIRPEEVGDLVVFLASGSAKHITGQEIAVDGNMEWED